MLAMTCNSDNDTSALLKVGVACVNNGGKESDPLCERYQFHL